MAILLESSLGTSKIFDDLCKANPKSSPKDKAIKCIKSARQLTIDDIEASYLTLKQSSDMLTTLALRQFENGDTVLLYNTNDSMKVTKAVPFMTLRSGDHYTSYVFMDTYVTVSRDQILSVQPVILRDLLIGAFISHGLRNDYTNLSGNPLLGTVAMECYAKFVTRIINREFSIGADKNIYEKIKLWCNIFCLKRIIGTTYGEDSIIRTASKNLKYIDELSLQDGIDQYKQKEPGNFDEMIELFQTATTRMQSASMSTFLADWIEYYYAPALLAIDTAEYLLFMIVTLLSGNNMISVKASDIVKEASGIRNFRSELTKLI